MKRGIGFLSLLACMGAYGQNLARLTVPVMGHMLDPAVRQVRPVSGIPGAALLRAPLDLGAPVLDAAFPPSPDWFLTVLGPDRKLLLWRVEADGYVSRSLDAVPAAPDRIDFSPSGSSAAFYYRSSGALDVVGSLPEAPFLARRIDVSGWSGEGPLAVSDDGSAVIAGLPESNLLAVFSPVRRTIPLDAPLAAIAFRHGTHMAAAAAGAAVYLLRDVVSAPALDLLFLNGENNNFPPSACAFSTTGGRLILASPGGSLQVINISTGSAQRLFHHAAGGNLLQPFSGSLFRLNDPGPGPVWLLDTGAAEPRILFLPAGQGGDL